MIYQLQRVSVRFIVLLCLPNYESGGQKSRTLALPVAHSGGTLAILIRWIIGLVGHVWGSWFPSHATLRYPAFLPPALVAELVSKFPWVNGHAVLFFATGDALFTEFTHQEAWVSRGHFSRDGCEAFGGWSCRQSKRSKAQMAVLLRPIVRKRLALCEKPRRR